MTSDETRSGASAASPAKVSTRAEARPPRPILRIVRGNPTPEEVAALVAVLGSLRAPAPPRPGRTTSAWADPGRRMRSALAVGPSGWRNSALPR